MKEDKKETKPKAEEKEKVEATEVEVEEEDAEMPVPPEPALSQPSMGRVTNRPVVSFPPPPSPPPVTVAPVPGPPPVVAEEFVKPEPIQGEDDEAVEQHSIASRGMSPSIAPVKGTLVGGARPPGRPG